MNLALFTEMSVQEFYDSTVTQVAERRVFSISDEDICSVSAQEHIENILTALNPGRLVLDIAMNEESHTEADQKRRIQRWMEFCGALRLLMLRPRQYYASPPHISALQPPALGQPGRIIITQSVSGVSEGTQFNEFCASEFGKITDFADWVNQDLDYYEQVARGWLLTMIQARQKRYCDSAVLDVETVRDDVAM
ncbi:MAG: hypothetical protein WC824_15070 [Bacteroidota bacterium]|jgi:hypothetical protein